MIDVEISQLLGAWEPRVGKPTCGPGCSRCCERMTVIVSSPEALRLVNEAPEFAQAVSTAVARLALKTTAEEALNSLLDLGPCVYLGDRKCQVYESRPDACRACHVWHDAWYCGREDYDMCTPAELNSLRLGHLHERMVGEFAAKRRPFRGYLLPAVWLMQRRRAEYLAGEDLSVGLDRRWIDADLLEFPTLDELTTEKAGLDVEFANQDNPMGFPRGGRVENRAMLKAFGLRE